MPDPGYPARMPQPVRVVAAVLCRDGAVLIAQRAPPRAEAGCWELPGGKVDPGEDDTTALIREIQEELGVTVVPVRALATAVHAYDHVTIELVAWACDLVAGEPQAIEHAALAWVHADALDGIAWAPADVPLIPAVRTRLTALGAPPGVGSPRS